MNRTDLLVIGGGPAGLSCSGAAATRGANVRLLEAMPNPGRRLLASGNGRCNLTNALETEAFIRAFGDKARFVAPALRNYPPSAWRADLKRYGIECVLPDGFHYFPSDGKSSSVLNALKQRAFDAGVELVCNKRAVAVRRDGNGFLLRCSDGSEFSTARLALCSGGRSCPELGGSCSGCDLAESLGHRIEPCVPALAGLHVQETWPGDLSGIALNDSEAALLTENGTKPHWERGELLFTHRGFSGPAVLDLAGRANRLREAGRKVGLLLRFRAGEDTEAWRGLLAAARVENGKKSLKNLLCSRLPQQLATALLRQLEINGETTVSRVAAADVKNLCDTLGGTAFNLCGSDGFAKAMATSGGVALDEVNAKTMESRLVPGLFFAGELLDVDGRCGGYNIQWAVSSGMLAACHC